jgi:phage-related minor tail protein
VNLRDAIEQLFTDVRDVAQLVAPLAAVIGFVGLGVMYLSSSWPILGDWRKDNPKAASTVVVGLLFLLLVGSVTTLITFG